MKVAFLDRDGVINKEINYLSKIADFEYTENCIQGLKTLSSLGYRIIIVTNQAGIAKGYFNEKDYFILTNWYLNDLKLSEVEVLDVFYCPHHSDGVHELYSTDCNCRKPKPGLLAKAISKYDIDLKHSIMVGDKVSDVEAGLAAGVNSVYLVESGHELSHEVYGNYEVFENLFSLSKYLGEI